MTQENPLKTGILLIYSALRAGAIGSVIGALLLAIFFLTVTILNNNYHHENWPMMEMLIPLSSVVFSLIWTIPSSLIIGILIHYILSKMGVRNYFSYGTASFFAAYFLLSYLFPFSPSFPSDLSMKLTLSAIFGIPTGVAFRALNRGDSTKEPNF